LDTIVADDFSYKKPPKNKLLRELASIRDKIVSAHNEFHRIELSHAQKVEELIKTKRDLEQSVFNQFLLLDAANEDMRILLERTTEKERIYKDAFVYQAGYTLAEITITEIFMYSTSLFNELENCLLHADTDGTVKTLKRIDELIKEAKFYFEPYCNSPDVSIQQLVSSAAEFAQKVVEAKGIKIITDFSGNIFELEYTGELRKVVFSLSIIFSTIAHIFDLPKKVKVAVYAANRLEIAVVLDTGGVNTVLEKFYKTAGGEKVCSFMSTMDVVIFEMFRGSFRINESGTEIRATVRL
jgi:hypothetical protein